MDMGKEKPYTLVVEDDAEMRETLSDILSEEGHEVKTAGKGKEALALAGKEKCTVCLIDLKLPDISGIEVLRGLKELNPEAYAIIITAFASKETAIEALKVGAYSYIEKPIHPGELLHVVKRASDSYRVQEEKKRVEEERERFCEELEAKSAEMERFIYTVSHDLKTPLVTIRGFAGMLREDLERNERVKVESDLKHIEDGATKMDHLLSDTLQLSRIGRVINLPEDTPFREIVQETLEQIAGQIKTVEVSMADGFPVVHVDRLRMVEVLVNLIENSISYMGEQPHPKIDIGHRVDDGGTVFFVRDNGIGIDHSQREKVFVLFYQVNKNSKGTGSGAGLTIVKRIIEVHGGRVWIESEKGKGCAVCFTLPLPKGEK